VAESSSQTILLAREGELAEFHALLAELAVPVHVCGEGLPSAEMLAESRLVIAPAPRLLETGTPDLGGWPRTIAVVEGSSKSIAAHLNRIGVGIVIRRPIHPRALRLLLLHEIYRGPERRLRGRVLIDEPIRLHLGFRRVSGRLLELSPSGARLEMRRALSPGRTLRLVLDREFSRSKPMKLEARVIRCHGPAEGTYGPFEIGLSLLEAHERAEEIDALLRRIRVRPVGSGSAAPAPAPASVRAAPPSPELASAPPTETVVEAPLEPPVEPPPEPIPADTAYAAYAEPASTEIEEALPAAPDPEAAEDRERRRESRVRFARKITALGEEADRVLLGRDLSTGGMRIVPNAFVELGETLRIALHARPEDMPLVVRAEVVRDDGEQGLVLGFRDVDPRQRSRLDEIISASAPMIEGSLFDARCESRPSESLVIGEMLDAAS